MCQQEDPNRRCLSTGECRRCKFVAGTGFNTYEGCVITSSTPICDADSDTTAVEYATSDYLTGTISTYAPEAGNAHLKTPNCVECKMAGKFQPMHSTFYCDNAHVFCISEILISKYFQMAALLVMDLMR